MVPPVPDTIGVAPETSGATPIHGAASNVVHCPAPGVGQMALAEEIAPRRSAAEASNIR